MSYIVKKAENQIYDIIKKAMAKAIENGQLPEGEVPETSGGGGRGYGGRYRGGSSRAADLGDSVGAVKSIANSGTTSNSSKYMRQALDDVISQSKKRKNAEPTVKWEDLLAGYVKGIK
jgi:hypothetical protein